MPEPLWQLVSLAQGNWYVYFLQFSYLFLAVLLECFLSIRTHFYSSDFFPPFLFLILFQFWIYSHWIGTFKALPSPTGFPWPSDIMRRLAFRGAGCALVKLVNYRSSTSFTFSVLPCLFPSTFLKICCPFHKEPLLVIIKFTCVLVIDLFAKGCSFLSSS